jgi:phage N-6-adenine-methyltransferase
VNRDLMFSSKNNCWCTPRDFYDKLHAEFNFNLDPCATDKSALCAKYFTPEIDGLAQNWGGHRAFVNPPYGRETGKWVKKAYNESFKPNTTIVMLIPARTDTKYFHEYIYGVAEIRFVRGRLKFIDMDYIGREEDRKISPAPFPSMVVIFKSEVK